MRDVRVVSSHIPPAEPWPGREPNVQVWHMLANGIPAGWQRGPGAWDVFGPVISRYPPPALKEKALAAGREMAEREDGPAAHIRGLMDKYRRSMGKAGDITEETLDRMAHAAVPIAEGLRNSVFQDWNYADEANWPVNGLWFLVSECRIQSGEWGFHQELVEDGTEANIAFVLAVMGEQGLDRVSGLLSPPPATSRHDVWSM